MKHRRPPALTIHTTLVRPIGDRVVYLRALDGQIGRLPGGVWSRVAVLPDVEVAIRDGDLEKQPGSEATTTDSTFTPAQTVQVRPDPWQIGYPDLTVDIWTGKPAVVASELPPDATGKVGKQAQVAADVQAMIPLVDQEKTVDAAARAVLDAAARPSDRKAVASLARSYRRHHQKIRRQMEAARKVSVR